MCLIYLFTVEHSYTQLFKVSLVHKLFNKQGESESVHRFSLFKCVCSLKSQQLKREITTYLG